MRRSAGEALRDGKTAGLTTQTRAWIRLALGFAQMGGAVFTLTLLATIGVHTWTIAAAVATTALSAGSSWFFTPHHND